MNASIQAKDALTAVRKNLHSLANKERAEGSMRFFKTGPGEYGEGDKFLGLTVPQVRSLVPRHHGPAPQLGPSSTMA